MPIDEKGENLDPISGNVKDNIMNKNESDRLKNIKDVNIDHIKEWVEKRETPAEILSISIWLKIKALCCSSRLSKIDRFYMKLYNRSIDIINNNMDMINYLKFMQEYINLKCILFDDIQSLCLSFIRKPKVYEKNRFLKINSHSHKKLKEIILFFKEHNELGVLDEKIYDLLSDDVKNFISQNTKPI